MSEPFLSGVWDPVHKDVNGWTAHSAEWERRRHPCLPQMEVRMVHSKQGYGVRCLKFRKPVSQKIDCYTQRSERRRLACCRSRVGSPRVDKDAEKETCPEPSFPKEESRKID